MQEKVYFILGRFARPVVVLCILFFSAVLRDVTLDRGAISALREELLQLFGQPFQFWLVGGIIVYLVCFMALNWKKSQTYNLKLSRALTFEPLDSIRLSHLILATICFYLLIRYVLQYELASANAEPLVFFFCILLNQWLIWTVTNSNKLVITRLRWDFINTFIVFGCICPFARFLASEPNSIFRGDFFYHGATRWAGIFHDPNIFGQIMSVAFVFSCARVWHTSKQRAYGQSLLYFIAVAISGISVLESYSRGAWLASLCGLIFIIWDAFDLKELRSRPLIKKAPLKTARLFVCVVIGFSAGLVLVCAATAAAHSQTPLLQRVVSLFSNRDFSSNNRLASYQDGINMLLDHPLAGYGWQNLIAIHSAFYLQSGLSTGEAVKSNGFLVLALRLGLPLSTIFLIYIRIWFVNWNGTKANFPVREDLMLCRVAVLTLAIGFCFTDGLFCLVTGGCFWLFLTLCFDFTTITT